MHRKLLVIVLFFIIAVSGASTFAEQYKRIIFAHPSDCLTLDPAKIMDTESSLVASQIFETLVFFDANLDLKPHLAESYTVSDNGKEYIFYLRKGVFFHDGSELDAETVAINFLRQIDPQNPYYQKDAFPTASSRLQNVLSIEAISKYKVRIRLEKPFSPFLSYLSMIENAVISKASMASFKDKGKFIPYGTGPFKFKQWDKEKAITLVKNDRYWRGVPKIDELVISVIKNNGLRFLNYSLGYIDGMSGFSPEYIKFASQNPDLALYKLLGTNISYLSINNKKKPFDNRRVRQALSLAINKDAMVRYVFRGNVVNIKNMLSPAIWGYNPNVEVFSYNPDLAKKILEEEGLGNDFEIDLWVTPVARPYLPKPLAIAQYIKSDLEGIGLRVNLITDMSWEDYLDRTAKGEHSLALLGWMADIYDPDNFFYSLFHPDSGMIDCFYENKVVMSLLEQARTYVDIEKRKEVYFQIQEILRKDLPSIPLFTVRDMFSFRSNIKNVKWYPTLQSYNFWEMEVER